MTLRFNTKTTAHFQLFVKKLNENREKRGFYGELNHFMCGGKMMKQNRYTIKNLLVIISRCLKNKCEKKKSMTRLLAE